jgi:hypothetical protein
VPHAYPESGNILLQIGLKSTGILSLDTSKSIGRDRANKLYLGSKVL